MPCLGQSQQGVRVAALEDDARFQSCHAAGRVKGAAKSEPAIHEQQRKFSKTSYLDGTTGTERRRRMTNGQQFNRTERKTPEVAFIELDRVQQILTEMDFPPLKQCQYLAAGPLADPYLNIGIPLCITKQKARQDTFDVLRGASNFQDTSISTTEQLSLLFDGAGAIKKNAATRNHLLTLPGQEEPASDPIEQTQSEFLFEIDDLSRQGRLGDPQPQRRL
jgi:hypothetical protein